MSKQWTDTSVSYKQELIVICDSIAQFLNQRFPGKNISVNSVESYDGWKIKVYYTNSRGSSVASYFSQSDGIADVVSKLELLENAEEHSSNS